MIVIEIIDAKMGVVLALTDRALYLVGIGYKLGMEITTFKPELDFCQTPNLQIAKHMFEIKTGV